MNSMNEIQIVCDSTAAFTAQEIDEMNLAVVPLSIQLQGNVFDEGLPETYDAFYDALAKSKSLPTTSQPPASKFQEVFEKALKDGKDVIAIVLSANLSGTYSSAVMAARQIGSDRITVVDSNSAVSNLKQLIRTAWVAANHGSTPLEIKEMIETKSPKMNAIFTVGDLIYLKRGGRLNNSQYFVGKLLNILPLILLREGVLYPRAKVKGTKALFALMQQIAPADTKGITVLQIGNLEGARQLVLLLKERFPTLDIGIDRISPVIGSHLGPGALGYCFDW
jgi:DegV family protein with EDD domain